MNLYLTKLSNNIAAKVSFTNEVLQAFSQQQDIIDIKEDVVLSLPKDHDDVILLAFSYLDSRSLCTVRAVNRRMKQALDVHYDNLWFALCSNEFPGISFERDKVKPSGYRTFIELALRRAQDRHYNYAAMLEIQDSLSFFRKSVYCNANVIYGALADIIVFRNERMARSVSYRRRTALSSIIIDSQQILFHFRKVTRHSGPVSFLPIDSIVANLEVGDRIDAVRENLPAIDAPGFIGYVVDLAELRRGTEYLRHTVLRTIFKDMSVWETTAHALAYQEIIMRRQLEADPYSRPNPLYYCSLDFVDSHDFKRQVWNQPRISPWGFGPLMSEPMLKRAVTNCLLSLKALAENPL